MQEDPGFFWTRKRYWIRAAFLSTGVLSILLLLLVGTVARRAELDAARGDVLMDIQIHVSMAHEWLEEVLDGDARLEQEEGFLSLDKGLQLVEVLLEGGLAEHGESVSPIEDNELRAQVEEIQSLVYRFKAEVLKYLTQQDVSRMRVESALHDEVMKEFRSKARALEQLIEKRKGRKTSEARVLFWVILAMWTIVLAGATNSVWAREWRRERAEASLLDANIKLKSQTLELDEHRGRLAELVARKTDELSSSLARVQMEIAERVWTEGELRGKEEEVKTLSARLLQAQEFERKRISMELHDELGQALNVIKLQVRGIEQDMDRDAPSRGDYIRLLYYIDEVIENVRRLSADLSPTVLEDLGLTSSLLWLMNPFSSDRGLEVTCDIAEVDHLVAEDSKIVIYRVLQEGLTNIRKHANARNIEFVVRRHDNEILFLLEDDGNGFDRDRVSALLSGERLHFGLKTMAERIKAIEGDFELWSEVGKGTRILLKVPIVEREV